MITSKQILDHPYYAEKPASIDPFLWEDHDYTLLHTPFILTNDVEWDQQALIHWWMNIIGSHSTDPNFKNRQEVFGSWSSGLYKRFKFINTYGIDPFVNQYRIKFSPYKNESIERQIEELNMWIPHIKTRTKFNEWDDEIKGKAISIFEKNLSEFGCYTLYVDGNDYKLGLKRHGSEDIIRSWKDLNSAILYICDRIYYNKRLK